MNSIEPNLLEQDNLDGRSFGRILVVDDEKNIRSSLKMVLENSGFDVTTAGNGIEAQDQIQESSPDVILLDVRLPGKSGVDLLVEWKKMLPQLPIILMSGEATLSEALEGLKRGAFDFLEKPILSARVISTLRHAMERVRRQREVDLGGGEALIGSSPAFTKAIEQVHKIAATKARVLITGESGTGKDLLARLIHKMSARRDGPFVKINCASIPHELVESELFGHVKGAFTGAHANRRGYFEAAHGGTLFLDEIGELPLPAQAKILRVLQTGDVSPVGSTATISVDVRVVSATHRDLKADVKAATFREDLYYRLAVVMLDSPPLRERVEDIRLLVHHFLKQLRNDHGFTFEKPIESSAMQRLERYSWPGNIRELRNVIERCLILGGDVIGIADLPPEIAACIDDANSKVEWASQAMHQDIEPWHIFKERSERAHVIKALRMVVGNISEAARLLHVERQTVHKWIKAYGIDKSEFHS